MMQDIQARRLGLALAALALTFVGCSKKDTYNTDTAAGSVALPSDSANTGGEMALPTTAAGVVDFLKTVDTAEVEAGQLAKTKATNAQVKSFAQTMVTEHGSDLKKLNRMSMSDSMAAGESSAIVSTLRSKHQEMMDRLQNMSGSEFDRAYMDAMVNGHQEVLDALRQLQSSPASSQWSTTDTAEKAGSGSLQQTIDGEISAVEKHLERARTIQGKLTGAAGSDTTRR